MAINAPADQTNQFSRIVPASSSPPPVTTSQTAVATAPGEYTQGGQMYSGTPNAVQVQTLNPFGGAVVTPSVIVSAAAPKLEAAQQAQQQYQASTEQYVASNIANPNLAKQIATYASSTQALLESAVATATGNRELLVQAQADAYRQYYEARYPMGGGSPIETQVNYGNFGRASSLIMPVARTTEQEASYVRGMPIYNVAVGLAGGAVLGGVSGGYSVLGSSGSVLATTAGKIGLAVGGVAISTPTIVQASTDIYSGNVYRGAAEFTNLGLAGVGGVVGYGLTAPVRVGTGYTTVSELARGDNIMAVPANVKVSYGMGDVLGTGKPYLIATANEQPKFVNPVMAEEVNAWIPRRVTYYGQLFEGTSKQHYGVGRDLDIGNVVKGPVVKPVADTGMVHIALSDIVTATGETKLGVYDIMNKRGSLKGTITENRATGTGFKNVQVSKETTVISNEISLGMPENVGTDEIFVIPEKTTGTKIGILGEKGAIMFENIIRTRKPNSPQGEGGSGGGSRNMFDAGGSRSTSQKGMFTEMQETTGRILGYPKEKASLTEGGLTKTYTRASISPVLMPSFSIQTTVPTTMQIQVPTQVLVQQQAQSQLSKQIISTIQNIDVTNPVPPPPTEIVPGPGEGTPRGFPFGIPPFPMSGGTFAMPTFGKSRGKAMRRYSPSLIGIVSGKTTSKLPTGLSGMEIRLPYAPKLRVRKR